MGGAQFARKWLPFSGLVLTTTILRLPYFLNPEGAHSDAAVVGLQARHILQGEWNRMLWGTDYQGIAEVLLTALGFRLVGPEPAVAMAVQFLGYLIALGLLFDLLARRAGLWVSWVACLLWVFTPMPMTVIALFPPRQWGVTCVVLSFWLLDRASASRWRPWLLFSGAVTSALALYLDYWTIQFMPGLGLFGLGSAVGRFGWWGAGAAVGIALQRLLRGHPSSGMAHLAMARLRTNLEIFSHQAFPTLVGYTIPFSHSMTMGFFEPPWPFRMIQVIGVLLLLGSLGLCAYALVRQLRAYRYEALGDATWRLGAAGLVLIASSVVGFLLSGAPVDMWSARYLLPVLYGAPFALAVIGRRVSPGVLAMVLAPYLACAAISDWISAGVTAVDVYTQGPTPVATERGQGKAERELGQWLRQRSVEAAMASYWLAYRLDLLFGEQPTVGVVPGTGSIRYEPYQNAFAHSHRVAVISHPDFDPGGPEPLLKELKLEGRVHERVDVGGFTVCLIE